METIDFVKEDIAKRQTDLYQCVNNYSGYTTRIPFHSYSVIKAQFCLPIYVGPYA